MTSTVYFLIFAIAIFSISAYFITTGFSIANVDDALLLDTINEENEAPADFNSEICFKSILKRKNSTISKPIDVDSEIIRQRRQLKRNLTTLNYISLLESNPRMINNPKRMEEIKNLRQGLQRQILKNTKLLNSYNLSQNSNI